MSTTRKADAAARAKMGEPVPARPMAERPRLAAAVRPGDTGLYERLRGDPTWYPAASGRRLVALTLYGWREYAKLHGGTFVDYGGGRYAVTTDDTAREFRVENGGDE